MTTPTDNLRRREVLAAGGAGLGALVLGFRPVAVARSVTAASCVLAPEMTEGPYYKSRGQADTSHSEDMIYGSGRCGSVTAQVAITATSGGSSWAFAPDPSGRGSAPARRCPR
jgi:hypothetical protein